MSIDLINNKLDRVEVKQDRLLDIVYQQSEILVRMQAIQEQHHASLEEHHRRTTISEERLLLLETKDHKFQAFIKGAIWVLGGVISIGGVLLKFLL